MCCYKNVGRPPMSSVSNGHRSQKDINMKLLCILAAILAVSLANDATNRQNIEDLEAVETVELMKKDADLQPAASAYNYVPQNQIPNQWNQQQSYVPQNTWTPPQEKPLQPINTYVPAPKPIVPPQQDYVPQNTWTPPQEKPIQPINTYVPPPKPIVPPQQDYVPPYHPPTWTTPHYHHQTTTTPIPVIKNEMYYGENGSYKYEYQIADGTHVGEEGYFTDPKGTEESLVKKGWYSYTGADGKVYTVTYWADKTGFHAYGDHLPTPPPVPAAIQAALDQNAKEEAAQLEAEKNKPQTIYYPPHPTYAPTPAPTHYPTPAPTYYPHPTYNPYPTYYPQSQYPSSSYGKK